MNKEKLKGKIIKGNKEQYLSAQEYAQLTSKEKADIRAILTENEMDADDYEKRMKKLWPKVFKPKPLIWRNRG